MAGPRFDFRILGPLEVTRDGEPLSIPGARQRALLTILLLNANRVVSLDRLIAESPDESADAEHRLRVQVSRLRKLLGTGDSAGRLVTRAPGYLLALDPEELDVTRFEALVGEGRRALEENDAERAASKIREAEALWRGTPLADVELHAFAEAEVERLEGLRLAAVEDRIEAELALGRQAQLVLELEALVRGHPLRERLRGQLMLALYRSGRQADALEAYRAGRSNLVNDLGLEPGPRLRELEQAILRQDETLQATRAPAGEASKSAPAQRVPAPRRGLLAALLVGACVVGSVVVAIVLGSVGEGSSIRPPEGDALVLVSINNGRLGAAVPLSAAPTRVAEGFGSLWVTHVDAATVSRIDLGTKTVRQTIQVGGGPSGITAAHGAVWVANTLDGTVSRIDPATNTVVETIRVGSQPSAVASAAGSVWVANRGDGTVMRLDPRSGRVSGVLSTGEGPSDLGAAGSTLWVANEDSGTVARIDARNLQLVETIHVGEAPSVIAVTAVAIWVLDRLDSTVSRIDPVTDAVTETIPASDSPSGLAVEDGSVWISNVRTGALMRVDPGRARVVRTTVVGQTAGAIHAASGLLWVAAAAGGKTHRGGTLTVVKPVPSIRSVDPAVLDDVSPLSLLGLTNDGLVTLAHVTGPDGARLVPDLALSLAAPADGGRTYTFRLRPGIRYSTGKAVRARDVRHSLERVFELRSAGRSFYDAIVGARGCEAHTRCDLSHGVVTDDRTSTVTFHLTAPDPDFLFKLAQPYAFVLPASTPSRDLHRPLPATGPYVISSYEPSHEIRLVRNPRFREWSSSAQPDGYPDRIVLEVGVEPARAAQQVLRGRADLLLNWGPLPSSERGLVDTRFSSHLRVDPNLATDFLFLNVRAKPFDDARVRRALNFAIDRNRLVEVNGGRAFAEPTCQILPPQMPGYERYCPYTRSPTIIGRWRGPDLAQARRLIDASGTAGMVVKVWDTPTPQVLLDEGRYVTRVLRRLGYRASLHVLPDAAFYRYTDDSRNRAQVISGGWSADYPSPSAFFGKLTCAAFIPNSTSTFDDSEFCDPAIDREVARADALQATDPAAAKPLWARLDRDLTDRAIWLPTVTGKTADLVSDRVGNYQYHPFWGAYVDQLWVR
jgi:YVTN family beta-propeller protein